MASSRLTLLLFSLLAALSLASPIQKRALTRVNEPGLMGQGTYPRATTLKDGSILGCYTAFSGGNSILTIVKSTNGGWDWTKIGSVATAPTATRDLDNCFVHQLPNGRVLAAFRNHDRTAPETFTFYRIDVCYSDDSGANWKYLTTAVKSPTPKLGVWEPFLMDALDGSLMMYFSRETNTDGSDQDSILIRSYDNGATWSAEQTISGAGITARDGMLGVARLGAGSGNLIAVFESLAPDTGIHSITSSDDGKTWGNRRLVYKSSVGGAIHSAPQVVYVKNTLITSFQTNEDNLSAVANVKVVASTDGGASWGQKTTVLDACKWAGELVIDSQYWLVLCESGGASLSQRMQLS